MMWRLNIPILLTVVLAAPSLADDPAASPSWIDGYRVRFALRVIDDLLTSDVQTIIARIPTGGWLKPDATDIRVRDADGQNIPAIVLAHDPLGDTIIQFRRRGNDRWYWVYVSNPNAPGKDLAFEAKVATAKEQSLQAGLLKMRLAKESAKKAAALRDLRAAIARQDAIFKQASTNLDTWQAALPQREAERVAADAVVPPAKASLDAATIAHAPFQKVADEKTALARAAATEASRARAAANKAANAHNAAVEKLDATTQLLAADPPPSADQKVVLRQQIADLRSSVPALKTTMTTTETSAAGKEAVSAAAAKVAADARLAAAPTDTVLKQARTAHGQVTGAANRATVRVTEAKNAIKSESKLKADSQAALAKLRPTLPATEKAATDAKAANDHALVDARQKEAAYFDLAAAADPRLLKEGLTVEFREWGGDKLADWAEVVEGLRRSDNVLGGAVVDEVLQNVNPFRRADPRNFAASYRGFLKVDQPGVYSFFVNGDDATFLFINGYKVYSRTGTNTPLRGGVKLYGIGADIQLEEGVHPFEVHHVIGNTSRATGLCTFMWLTPGSKQWQWVPSTAFNAAMTAVPVGVEAWDGRPIAVFDYSIDDVLTADGVSLYLARFAAATSLGATPNVAWTFADGTTSSDPSLTHIFFDQGDSEVGLQSHPAMPAFTRRCHVWMPANPTGPHAIRTAVEVFSAIDVTKLAVRDLNDVYYFLRLCDQPGRWLVMERVCRHLLSQEGLDIKYRALLYGSLMKAIATQGRGAEALKVLDQAAAEVGALRTLDGAVRLDAANVQRHVLKDYRAAGGLYAQIIQGNERLRHPLIKQAAVAWGDMYLDAGDVARAGQAYRLARELGSVGAIAEGKTDAVKRGALLRVAEQQLRQGNVEQTHRLLWRIEQEFPEQKLEGLYRYLRGDSERHAGRYDQAIRDYEMLLTMRQWAGFRAQALYGIADCYYRMEEPAAALTWLTELQESFPDVYEQRELDAYRQNIERRSATMAERQGAAADDGDSSNVTKAFSERRVDFEPESDTVAAESLPVRYLPSLGFDGSHTAMIASTGGNPAQVAEIELKNLPPQGRLWVELWYRTRGASARGNGMIQVSVFDDAKRTIQNVSVNRQRTFGQWHKIALDMTMPTTLDGTVRVLARENEGILDIDGVRVRHVSDRQRDALGRFVQGADPQ